MHVSLGSNLMMQHAHASILSHISKSHGKGKDTLMLERMVWFKIAMFWLAFYASRMYAVNFRQFHVYIILAALKMVIDIALSCVGTPNFHFLQFTFYTVSYQECHTKTNHRFFFSLSTYSNSTTSKKHTCLCCLVQWNMFWFFEDQTARKYTLYKTFRYCF